MSTTDNTPSLGTLVLLAIALLVLLPALTMGFGMMGWGGMMGPGMWGYGGNVPTWMLIMGFLGPLLFLLVLVGGGYLLFKGVRSDISGNDPAIEELRTAYARGDISDEEFEERRERLQRDER
ncbi:SHOCT domain-containing protein [Halorussus halophilus]|uniref:SHOCT domain-containing protein n=1 Tax=Halorussus halophilus TaxID=2650975 RepID=UPI0013012F67|nr:SHOCT domain-containing protein [Halorussus halophilus]